MPIKTSLKKGQKVNTATGNRSPGAQRIVQDGCLGGTEKEYTKNQGLTLGPLTSQVHSIGHEKVTSRSDPWEGCAWRMERTRSRHHIMICEFVVLWWELRQLLNTAQRDSTWLRQWLHVAEAMAGAPFSLLFQTQRKSSVLSITVWTAIPLRK